MSTLRKGSMWFIALLYCFSIKSSLLVLQQLFARFCQLIAKGTEMQSISLGGQIGSTRLKMIDHFQELTVLTSLLIYLYIQKIFLHFSFSIISFEPGRKFINWKDSLLVSWVSSMDSGIGLAQIPHIVIYQNLEL